MNDCTTDASLEKLQSVIDDYPARKKQVKVLHHEVNKGQAQARKTGILAATGDYVIHCDSDDWLDVEAYKDCYDRAKIYNCDAVFFDFDRTDGISHQYISRNIPESKDEIIGGFIKGDIMASLCGMMVKREYYEKIIFWPEYNLCEDLLISVQLINNCSKFGYIPKAYYKYYINNDSITTKRNQAQDLKSFEEAYNNTKLVGDYLENKCLRQRFDEELFDRSFRLLYLISPYTDNKDVYELWKTTFKISFIRLLKRLKSNKDFKLVYILTKIKFYPLYYKWKYK